MGRPAQFNNNGYHPQQLPPKYGAHPPNSQPPVGYTYETFQSPGVAAAPPTMGPISNSASMASSPTATPRSRDYVTDNDTAMGDADPYNHQKYQSRPNHNSRASTQFYGPEESSAARRYSPMNALSPGMPYNTSPGKPQNYGFPGSNNARRSPTKNLNYPPSPSAYQSPPGMLNSLCERDAVEMC